MRFYVNERCMGCGLCIKSCPTVFSVTEFGAAEVIRERISEEHLPDARYALDNCPAFAIEEMA